MKLLLRGLMLLVVAVPFLAIAALLMCFQDRPLVTRTVQLAPRDIEKAKLILDEHDPRKSGPGGVQTVVLDQQDLELALNYLASRLSRGAMRVGLQPGVALVQGTLELPQSPIGHYVNVDAVLRETGSVPRFDRLEIGHLPVPAFVADFLLREGLRRWMATERGELAADVIRKVKVGEGRVAVTYFWSDAVADRARAVLVSPEDQARLRAYQERLADVVAKAPAKVSLATLMPPLFLLAVDRGATGDIVRENRAVIVVLAFYANGKGLGEIVSAAKRWAQPLQRTVTLTDRDDFPKHFLISAALAAEAGTPMADVIGVYKEIDDSHGGSGFSFNDLGADRAGTRFGEVATQSPERARKLARAIASGVTEGDFMPEVLDLPEFMQEAEFKRRYGGIGGPGYQKMMATIEARVASRPLLR